MVLPKRRFLLAVFALAACSERRPWDQGDAGALAGAMSAPALPSATASIAPADSSDPAEPPVIVRVGGSWVRCYGQFKPSGEPVRDVTRLGLLCGPSNGMRRTSKSPVEGNVTEGGPAQSSPVEVRRGACYRFFAVAEPSVADLDITVRTSRGTAIAEDDGSDAWPVVRPDRPVCALEDDRWTFEVRAHKGSGRFAAEVWALGPGRD